ncbi:hypothetical protein [Plantactinospora sp. WMMB782]|uniref:hypothetical protein n=1 Tax=Plantactinospora sp. WMMB782 TaxID=3404121 RepID=UPI003B955BD3
MIEQSGSHLIIRGPDAPSPGMTEIAMQDQLVLAIATALAAKGGEALIMSGGSALGRLYRLLRDRFRAQGKEVGDLVAGGDEPGAIDRIRLAEKISQLLADDPDLRGEVERLWRAAEPEVSAQPAAVINQFSGTAERVVQARDIRGDVSF